MRRGAKEPNAEASSSIRCEYERHGAKTYYQQFGATYRNPHEPIVIKSVLLAVQRWPLDLSNVLDLAAGSGEVTLALRGAGATRVQGVDPYTAQAYQARTGQAAEELSFADIAAGAMADRRYSLIVCSFALHLCEPSRLPALMAQLRHVSDLMLILTPHKKPEIRKAWGWELVEEIVVERVRSRWYRAQADAG
jgi:SAM-dependent methyltransferase